MYAIVMAGGSGTRFWPASRQHLPKQFLTITGESTMFEQSLDRVSPLIPAERVLVVVNRLHEALTRQLTAGRYLQVLVEPVGRNTAACIGLAALYVARENPDAPMIILPADHFVAHPRKFTETLASAAEIASTGCIVTLGATPTRPETGYGYIELANENRSGSADQSYFSVARFVEKPDQATALEYLSSGNYLWNCGIFAFTASTILRELEICVPQLFEGLCRIDRAIGTPDYESTLQEVYPSLESISIDYAVMERTKVPIYVLPAHFGWSDVGSWQAVYELSEGRRDDRNNFVVGDAAFEDSEDNLVYSKSGRLVALLGVKGLAVIDTPDALLVADLNRSQEVKKLPEALKGSGRGGIC